MLAQGTFTEELGRCPEGDRPPAELLARAHKIIDSLAMLHRRCLQAIGDEMLDLYNKKGWRGDKRELSRDEFIRHFKLVSISISDEEGDGLGYFPEDELFTEHGVTVTIEDGEIADVSLD